MKLMKNRESGFAMVLVLILLALGALTVTPALNLAYTNIKYHGRSTEKYQEVYAADAGVQYAMCMLHNDPYTDDFTDNFTLNDRTVTVTAEYMGNNIVNFTSTATSPSGRSTTIKSGVQLPSIFSEHVAIAGEGGVVIQDSYINSSPVANQADIHSNSDINLSSDSNVDGYITYLGAFNDEGGGYIDEIQVEEEEVQPPIDTEFWKEQAKAGGTRNGNLILDDREDYTLGPKYITGNLEIKDCEDMRLNGTVYVEGEIKIEDESEINRGSGALIAVGDVNIWNDSRVGTSSSPVLIMSVNGKVKCAGDDEDPVRIYGLIYAPNSIVELQDVRFWGSVVGHEVVVKESQTTYITEFEDPERLYNGEVNIVSYGYGP